MFCAIIDIAEKKNKTKEKLKYFFRLKVTTSLHGVIE